MFTFIHDIHSETNKRSSCDFFSTCAAVVYEMLRSGYPCLNFNNSLNRRVPLGQLRCSQTLTLGAIFICPPVHTVCEELTRRSVVRSRIAVLYLCLKIYILERGGIIYFMSATDCPLFVCMCVCLALSGLALCTIGVC